MTEITRELDTQEVKSIWPELRKKLDFIYDGVRYPEIRVELNKGLFELIEESLGEEKALLAKTKDKGHFYLELVVESESSSFLTFNLVQYEDWGRDWDYTCQGQLKISQDCPYIQGSLIEANKRLYYEIRKKIKEKTIEDIVTRAMIELGFNKP